MPTIMKTRSICGFAVIATILTTTILCLGLLGNAQAQNTTAPQQQQTANPEQIKTYLTEAIQAMDSGNNTQALERVDLAGDQLEMLTGTQSVDDDDEDEDEGEIEEGTGEDADEAGDVDTNDEVIQ
jgi:cell division protein FtsX